MEISGSELSPYTHLASVVGEIGSRSKFQKKAVGKLVASAGERHLRFGDDFVRRLATVVEQPSPYAYLAEKYLWYTNLIRLEELHFAQSHEYRYSDYAEVYGRVYGRDDYMRDYAAGLGMTQIFWANHYAIVQYYLDRFLPRVTEARTGAEIGVGHGLFHSELLRAAPNITTRMLDVSPACIEFTRRMVSATGLDRDRAQPLLGDVQKEIPLPDASLDVLLMGEVVEHLEKGAQVMTTMATKVKPGGHCFFTTAANAPAEDHILLFRTTGEIRSFLQECGWKILEEHVGTLGGMSVETAEEGHHNINYAATLTPA